MLRALFERFFLSHWQGPGLTIRYWDNTETTAGPQPAPLTVHIRAPSVLREILWNPSLGFGHAYVDGRIEVAGDLQALLRSTFSITGNPYASRLLQARDWMSHYLRRESTVGRAEHNARFHYDRGNEFFRLWLDPSMTYSCAYFRTEADDLARAQQQKLELLYRKLDLQKGQTLLDVGCGWGSLLFHAIERYGVRGIGITPSREQASYIEAEIQRHGLGDRLTLHVSDWRTIRGAFDRVVSVGMYEHVGKEHGRAFFEKWAQWLKPQGVSVFHTIGGMESLPPDPWIAENIFPGGYLPALDELATHAAATGLIVTDVENLWRHYALTLAAWARNYAAARESIVRRSGERFYRTWWLYLNASEAVFAAGRIVLWQLVLTKGKRANQSLTRESWVLSTD